MSRSVLLFMALAITGAGVALSANAAPPTGTTTIALPRDVGPTFKPGPSANVAQRYCTTCHSPAYVAIQPPFTATQWTAEIAKMRTVYAAQIPAGAAAAIARYLTAVYGKQ